MAMTIGLIMHVLNEAEFLEASLLSARPFVEECIVCDQGSMDGSVEIAKRCGAHVFGFRSNFQTRGEKAFRDMAAMLAHVYEWDWMMIIDGDEILSDGWRDVTDKFIAEKGATLGMILIDYYQMIGSADFHTPNSPLPNERPFLVRVHPDLRGSESCNGTKCHSTYRQSIKPNRIASLPPEAFCTHLGYAKTDLTARFTRNIERCDWSDKPEINEQFLKAAREEPLNLLPECIPSVIPPDKLPVSLRVPKWKCVYNPETRRIIERIKL